MLADIRRLLARLNPATSRLDSARSGPPELTATDIAGALGHAGYDDDPIERERLRFAREVVCAIWWPEGSRLVRRDLLDAIARRQHEEISRQRHELETIRLEIHIIDDLMASTHAGPAEHVREKQRLATRLEQLRSRAWPCMPLQYRVLREAVLSEIASNNQCPLCGGRGSMQVGTLIANCVKCDGHGAVPVSDRQRAARIYRDHATYLREWRSCYEWSYSLVRDAESTGLHAIRRALDLNVAA